jgi:hypothetical protein
MAQCPKDGTQIDLANPAAPKTCGCPVCGHWVYPHLVVVAGTVELAEYKREALFGRADVSGSSAAGSVSRNHARFYPTEEGWNLVSLSERNVSEVNGREITMLQTVPLTDGDSIKFGGLTLTVKFKYPLA